MQNVSSENKTLERQFHPIWVPQWKWSEDHDQQGSKRKMIIMASCYFAADDMKIIIMSMMKSFFGDASAGLYINMWLNWTGSKKHRRSCRAEYVLVYRSILAEQKNCHSYTDSAFLDSRVVCVCTTTLNGKANVCYLEDLLASAQYIMCLHGWNMKQTGEAVAVKSIVQNYFQKARRSLRIQRKSEKSSLSLSLSFSSQFLSLLFIFLDFLVES